MQSFRLVDILFILMDIKRIFHLMYLIVFSFWYLAGSELHVAQISTHLAVLQILGLVCCCLFAMLNFPSHYMCLTLRGQLLQIDGIETQENMTKCLNNCHDLETFWKSWHASYNRYLVRYYLSIFQRWFILLKK